MAKILDSDLKRDVEKELEFDPALDATKISVVSAAGVITLTGAVGSYAEKSAAENIAKRVYGVKGVANDLEVVIDTAEYRDDAEIARSALNALNWNANLPKEKVKVIVSKGWVTLDGEVSWDYQRRAAADTVRNLRGVRGVTNDIAVRPGAAVGDVQQKIEAALKRSAEVEAKNIRVETSDGTVTLAGTVHSFAERQDAVNAAWSAPGVTRVVDRITIEV